MGITNDVCKVGGCVYAVSLMLDSFCASACQLEFVRSPQGWRGGMWFGMIFFSVCPDVHGQSWAPMLAFFCDRVWSCSEAGLDVGLEACLGVGLE